MTEVLVALIGAIGLIAVAYLEKGRRSSNLRWAQNREDHDLVIDKIDTLGKSLGRSIDRVEESAIRTEEKLDQHINDHVTGKLD
jgi:hypothetical protein